MAGNYDRVARFYEVDMARNMPFDDVAFYAGVCRRRPGPTLEAGCGTGRILLPLLAGGVAAVGIDASAGMLGELQRRARSAGRVAPVCRMDLRALAFRRAFDVVLLPYSLVTYLTGDDDLARTFAGVRDVLAHDGLLVVDAFIPRPVTPHADFRLDYRRPFGDAVLARWKRISPQGPAINRIERRYQVQDRDGRVLEQVDVEECIRPFAPDDVRALLARQGFALHEAWWDYGDRKPKPDAQFFTAIAQPARG